MELATLLRRCLAADYLQSPDGGDYALEREGDILYIFLEKSEGIEDWGNNADFSVRAYEREGKTQFYAHRGFLRVWESMLPYLAGEISDPFLVGIVRVGYSHGAALAVLCHEYVWSKRPDLRGKLLGYGFAAPRVIWGMISRRMARRWASFYVLRIPDDLVTHLPPAFLGYSHVGQMVELCEAGKYSAIDAHRAENLIRELERIE